MITDKTEGNNPKFGRILTAMVTPFTENGDVDYELAIKLANYLFDNGSDGIVLCGTTGDLRPSHGRNKMIYLLQ